MDTQRFKEIVTCFLASSSQLDMDKGELVLDLDGEFVNARLETRRGSLYIREEDNVLLAEEWLINRVASLPTLADRILTAIPRNASFVNAPGDFLDDITHAPHDETHIVKKAAETVAEFLNRRPGGTCSILYLTSDAGEGKTTLINSLARAQAEKYKKKETDWLLVPIGLGGRPFLRFDDVVVASLVNQLRFQRLYFDAFLELVRMGAIVPALDGFEEIFVENAVGDAISSLGTLIRQLGGEGSLLIAARKAYFEFRRLETQAKLLDGLPNTDVSFGRVALCRWSKSQFLEYADLRDIQFAGAIYDAVAGLFSEDHPLLTRPVLVRRLLELYQAKGLDFLSGLRPEANSYFAWLVDQLLEREAHEKWIDKHGDPPAPLLTVSEHHELLSYIAEEMWVSKTGSLSRDMLDSLADIFCETKRLSPILSRQVRERITQHALLVSSPLGKEFSFDHEEFRDHFLGEQLARFILDRSESDVRRLFRTDLIPSLTAESAFHLVVRDSQQIEPIVRALLNVASTESATSYVRENAGAMIGNFIACTHSELIIVEDLVFPPEALAARTFSNIVFKACYFRSSSLESSRFINCIFSDCEFEHLELYENTQITGSTIEAWRVHTLVINDSSGMREYYDPDIVKRLMSSAGFDVSATDVAADPEVGELDEDLKIAEKALQTFQRSTFVFEGTFKLRLSLHASRFFNVLLPKLLKAGVVELVQVAALQKYRLGMSFAEVSRALTSSNGTFEGFLAAVQRGK